MGCLEVYLFILNMGIFPFRGFICRVVSGRYLYVDSLKFVESRLLPHYVKYCFTACDMSLRRLHVLQFFKKKPLFLLIKLIHALPGRASDKHGVTLLPR